ncbi:MAG: RidA family protein [Planctomycetota bacterium]|jgi:enamine deaminase RidA (YjgF/YER057c/UK114 family)|nr:RidA family protein [Planctomycetota bacterium]
MMSAEQKAKELGLEFNDDAEPGYLKLAIRVGNMIITSGHTSTLEGKLGDGLGVDEGYAAARDCATKVLASVHAEFGTLDGLRCVKVLGCVNSALDFTDQHLVINGFSDLIHEVFGKEGDGYHARSALGFAQLPTGAAVEVEAIFEVK